MMVIVRLFPKTNLEKVWNYVENVIAKESSDFVTPLYSAQLEGMMSVGVIFDVKDPDKCLLEQYIPKSQDRSRSKGKHTFHVVSRHAKTRSQYH